MNSTIIDSMLATGKPETTPTTSLVQWTASPVMRPSAVACRAPSEVEDSLDTKDVRALRRHAERIAELRDSTNRTVTTAIIELGGELSAVHDLLAGKGCEGHFAPWCKSQGFSRSTAYRAIAAHKAFGKCPTVGRFDPSAVYLLSADSCPEVATTEAMRLAEQGEFVNRYRAKEILGKYLPKDTTNRKRLGHKPAPQPHAQKPTNGKQPQHQPPPETTEGENGGETTAKGSSKHIGEGDTDEILIGTVEPEQQAVEVGLAGLDAVAAVLKSLGILDEYQEALDSIRAALEQHALQDEDGEEVVECTF